jgi:hypothetical protein
MTRSYMLRRASPRFIPAAMTRALVFACPRDIGANSLRLEFREGTSAETSDAPITHSRNAPLYRYRAVERKAYRAGQRSGAWLVA